MPDIQIEHALSEEFEGRAEAIHDLRLVDNHFQGLLDKNRQLWGEIQAIQNGLTPTSDDTRHALERERLTVLDAITTMLDAAAASPSQTAP